MTTPGMAGKSSSAGRRDRLSSSEGAGDFGTCPPWITGTQKTSAEILMMGRDDTTLGQDQVAPELRLAQDAAADELLGRDPLALLLGIMLDQHMRQRSSNTRPVV